MLELLMQNYGISYNHAVELYKMPMMDLIQALDMRASDKTASKTEIETVDK